MARNDFDAGNQLSHANTDSIHLEARPEKFTVYLRIPAWADAKTRVAVNGKRVEGDLMAGSSLR